MAIRTLLFCSIFQIYFLFARSVNLEFCPEISALQCAEHLDVYINSLDSISKAQALNSLIGYHDQSVTEELMEYYSLLTKQEKIKLLQIASEQQDLSFTIKDKVIGGGLYPDEMITHWQASFDVFPWPFQQLQADDASLENDDNDRAIAALSQLKSAFENIYNTCPGLEQNCVIPLEKFLDDSGLTYNPIKSLSIYLAELNLAKRVKLLQSLVGYHGGFLHELESLFLQLSDREKLDALRMSWKRYEASNYLDNKFMSLTFGWGPSHWFPSWPWWHRMFPSPSAPTAAPTAVPTFSYDYHDEAPTAAPTAVPTFSYDYHDEYSNEEEEEACSACVKQNCQDTNTATEDSTEDRSEFEDCMSNECSQFCKYGTAAPTAAKEMLHDLFKEPMVNVMLEDNTDQEMQRLKSEFSAVFDLMQNFNKPESMEEMEASFETVSLKTTMDSNPEQKFAPPHAQISSSLQRNKPEEVAKLEDRMYEQSKKSKANKASSLAFQIPSVLKGTTGAFFFGLIAAVALFTGIRFYSSRQQRNAYFEVPSTLEDIDNSI